MYSVTYWTTDARTIQYDFGIFSKLQQKLAFKFLYNGDKFNLQRILILKAIIIHNIIFLTVFISAFL